MNKGNTSELLNQTSKSLMALKARLDRVVTSGDSLHTQIYENREKSNQEFTVHEDIPTHLKLRLREKNPPCTIKFVCDKTEHFDCYYSTQYKEPREG